MVYFVCHNCSNSSVD